MPLFTQIGYAITKLSLLFNNSVFGFAFIKLILDRIDFVGIDLIGIHFEVK